MYTVRGYPPILMPFLNKGLFVMRQTASNESVRRFLLFASLTLVYENNVLGDGTKTKYAFGFAPRHSFGGMH